MTTEMLTEEEELEQELAALRAARQKREEVTSAKVEEVKKKGFDKKIGFGVQMDENIFDSILEKYREEEFSPLDEALNNSIHGHSYRDILFALGKLLFFAGCDIHRLTQQEHGTTKSDEQIVQEVLSQIDTIATSGRKVIESADLNNSLKSCMFPLALSAALVTFVHSIDVQELMQRRGHTPEEPEHNVETE